MNAPRSAGARVLAFNLVGVLGFVVQIALLWLLVRVFGVAVLPATALAVEAAIVHNFLWHWRWTWSDRVAGLPGRLRCFGRFNATNGAVSLLVNVAVMALLHVVLDVPYLVANVGAVACASAANYLLGDRVVFPRAAEPATPRAASRQILERCAVSSPRG
ncbi:MAG: GtrA family protein [Bacteroidales bacterium]